MFLHFLVGNLNRDDLATNEHYPSSEFTICRKLLLVHGECVKQFDLNYHQISDETVIKILM